MHNDQWPWVDLYEQLMALETPVYPAVLHDWAAQHPAETRWLADFAARRGDPVPDATVEDTWRLYAASRVNDTLLLSFQTGDRDGSTWPGPDVTLSQYRQFASSLGLREQRVEAFHPFFHEIITVQQSSDDDEPITITGESWPCLMLGDMMFSRAGVAIRGGRRNVMKEPAETSCLYWATRRKHRPTTDLSVGWGHNSQWRTSFRRDYLIDGVFRYNVDARAGGGGEPDPDLTATQKRELLVNRCFVTEPEPVPGGHHFPYEETRQEPAPPRRPQSTRANMV